MEDVRRNLIKFEIGSSKRKKKIKSSLWNLFSRILNLPAYKKKKSGKYISHQLWPNVPKFCRDILPHESEL